MAKPGMPVCWNPAGTPATSLGRSGRLPLLSCFNAVQSADSARRQQAHSSIIVAASTPGPTGFAKIKSYHLLHVPHPLKQVIKGKRELSEADGGALDLHKVPFPWLRRLRGGMRDRKTYT